MKDSWPSLFYISPRYLYDCIVLSYCIVPSRCSDTHRDANEGNQIFDPLLQLGAGVILFGSWERFHGSCLRKPKYLCRNSRVTDLGVINFCNNANIDDCCISFVKNLSLKNLPEHFNSLWNNIMLQDRSF